MVNIYTDGACSGNPGPAGYGAILMHGPKIKEISGGYRRSTNNRMELLSVIKALECLKKDGLDITIYTDSKYVCDSIVKGWIFNWERQNWKDRKNADLWIKYLLLHRKHNIKFIWVKGHSDNEFNNRCDRLAVEAYKNTNLDIDLIYEQNNLI